MVACLGGHGQSKPAAPLEKMYKERQAPGGQPRRGRSHPCRNQCGKVCSPWKPPPFLHTSEVAGNLHYCAMVGRAGHGVEGMPSPDRKFTFCEDKRFGRGRAGGELMTNLPNALAVANIAPRFAATSPLQALSSPIDTPTCLYAATNGKRISSSTRKRIPDQESADIAASLCRGGWRWRLFSSVTR